MLHLIPRAIARPLLRAANVLRHRWRMLRKVHLAGVSVIVQDAQGRLLFVRHAYGSPHWAFPGGGLGKGEDPAACARREIREELGLTLHQLSLISTLEEVISGSAHTAHVFTAFIDAAPQADGREVVEARFFARDALPAPLSALTTRRLDLWLSRFQAGD